MSARLLVAEDDPRIAGELMSGLRKAGYSVEVRADGNEALALALREPFDLIVLDLMLPGRDGFDILRELQHRSSVPVIVLTARTDLDARLQSFGLGAVDWMPKPFFVGELLIRIQTRLHLQSDDKPPARWANAELNDHRRMVFIDGVDAGLTAIQFNILAHLVTRPGRVVTREQLADAALPIDGERELETVNSHIARIRKKLGASAGGHVKTVRGAGYCFE